MAPPASIATPMYRATDSSPMLRREALGRPATAALLLVAAVLSPVEEEAEPTGEVAVAAALLMELAEARAAEQEEAALALTTWAWPLKSQALEDFCWDW